MLGRRSDGLGVGLFLSNVIAKMATPAPSFFSERLDPSASRKPRFLAASDLFPSQCEREFLSCIRRVGVKLGPTPYLRNPESATE